METRIYPSVASEIVDKSFATITADGFTECIQVIVSEKGKDRELQYYASSSEFTQNYGDPSIKLYGQVNHNLVEWMSAGGAARILRVTADDAKFSHVVLDLATKIDGDTLLLKPKAYSLSGGLANSDTATVNTAVKAVAATDSEGYSSHPLVTFVPVGRGAAYDEMFISMSINDSYDDTFADARVYDFTISEMVDGVANTLAGPFIVSLDENAINDNRQSVFIETVLESYASDYIKAIVNTDAIEALGDDTTISPLLIDITSPSLQDLETEVDFFTDAGYTDVLWADLAATEGAANLTTDADFVDYSAYVYLKGGSDGDTATLATQTQLKVKGYNGLIDSNILDKNMITADIILDGNEDVSVKDAMVSLAETRGDCIAIIDTGITGSADEALDARSNGGLNWSTFRAAIFTQDALAYDQFAGRNNRMTSTFFLASKIPTNDIAYGIQRNFVGPRRGGLGSYTDMSWFPRDQDKTNLYKARVNYIEQSAQLGTYFATQNTTQRATSKLSDISIVRMLLRMQRNAENISATYEMEYINGDTTSSIQREIQDSLNEWVSNGGCESVSVSVTSNSYDKTQKRARVSIAVVPTSILERIMITFEVQNA